MKSFYETQADANDYIFTHYFISSSINAHFHKSLEIVYCLEGKMEVYVSGEKYILCENEMYFAPSYSIHYNRNVGANKILSFIFAHNFFHDFEKTYPDLTLPFILNDHQKNMEFLSLLSQFHNLRVEKKCDIPFIKNQTIINEMLYFLATNYKLQVIKQRKLDNLLLEIISYLNENYKEKLNLKDLSQRFNYCPQRFSEIFNNNIGCSLNSYLNNIRLEKALLEIENPKNKKTLTQIAFENGFNSMATFYRVLNENKKISI